MPSTRLFWAAAAAAVAGLAGGVLAATVPASADDDGQDTVVNCVAWDRDGDNIGDNLFYVDRETPSQTSALPIGQTEITCTNLPSSPDTVHILPGPHTSLGPLGPSVRLMPGETKVTHPTTDDPDGEAVFTVSRG